MDYKSIEDVSNLPKELIISEFENLYKFYNDLKLSDKRQLQEIHQLRRGNRFEIPFLFFYSPK